MTEFYKVMSDIAKKKMHLSWDKNQEILAEMSPWQVQKTKKDASWVVRLWNSFLQGVVSKR